MMQPATRPFWLGVALLLAGVAMGVAAAVLFLTTRDDEREPPVPRRALSAHGSLLPRMHLFGDAVTARIEVVADRRALNPDLIRLRPTFTPYEQAGGVRVTRRDSGNLTYLEYTYMLRCLQRWCVPRPARRRFELPPASLEYRIKGQAGLTGTHVEWPALDSASRVGARPAELAEWRGNVSSLPPASYRMSPGLLAGLLYAAGGVFGLVAALLAVTSFRRREGGPAVEERPAVVLPPLERALSLLEHASANGHADEQRKALELLARELSSTGETELARTARELAWSERAPSAEATRTLSAEVRRTIEGNSDGRAV